MNDDTIKKEFSDAGYICVRLKPIMYRIRGPYDSMDIFPLLGKYKRNGVTESSDNLLETARSYISPYEPCVTPELLAHRVVLNALVDHIEYKVLKRQ